MENRPRRLIEVIFESCVMFAIGAWLLKLGVCYLYQIRWALVIIGTVVLLAVAGARIYRYRKGQRWRDDDEIP